MDRQPYLAVAAGAGVACYLAVRVEAPLDAPPGWDLLAETLEDIGAGIGDELAAKVELDTMALELSERYEELHLVYAIDKEVQEIESGGDLFKRLLHGAQ